MTRAGVRQHPLPVAEIGGVEISWRFPSSGIQP
jgi:hypothetical protein